MTIYAKQLRNYRRSKLAVKKISRPFGFEATLFANLNSESLLFGRPGFDSWSAQTLMACNFATLWSEKTQSMSFERSKLCMFVGIKTEKLVWGTFKAFFARSKYP